MKQKMVVTEREVRSRKVPSGEKVIIPGGEFVNLTQDLGGNYTVTWRGNMLRIDGTDADAIGRKPQAQTSLPRSISTIVRIHKP